VGPDVVPAAGKDAGARGVGCRAARDEEQDPVEEVVGEAADATRPAADVALVRRHDSIVFNSAQGFNIQRISCCNI